MVFIEERIATLEETVKELSSQLAEALEEIKANNDKKRKHGQVDQEQLDKVVAELREDYSKYAAQEQVEKAVKDLWAAVAQKAGRDQLDKLVIDVQTSKKVNEDLINQTILDMQAKSDKMATTSVSRPDMMQAIGGVQQQLLRNLTEKVNQQQLGQALQNLQQIVQQKMQSTLDVCQNMLNTNQEFFKRMQSNSNQPWADVDLMDQGPFDVGKVYRVRIGDGPAARWLYSTEVSMGQVYTVDNVLDQAVVINSSSKGSYGTRRVGSDVNTTTYFAVFQLQCKVF
eukprot:CAMPEP_0117459860 /NCGR_PEP_ID=MMETSP0784-20121206/1699_1 /TAXON_ID=39447 /ORGANISM="" /LENGTH=283 /DNA_ID=CAMNT_0005253493 /DNA_START=15 /DNA_END=866 /DNA_ORIENTATION=-